MTIKNIQKFESRNILIKKHNINELITFETPTFAIRFNQLKLF